MFTFTSISPGYRIFGKPVKSPTSTEMIPEYDVKFIRTGNVGQFITKDEQLAQKLREHPEFTKRFVEIGIPKVQESNIVAGIRSSATQVELGKEPVDPKKYIRLGVLQSRLLKNDGTYRKDAVQEEISEYENLKKELGD